MMSITKIVIYLIGGGVGRSLEEERGGRKEEGKRKEKGRLEEGV